VGEEGGALRLGLLGLLGSEVGAAEFEEPFLYFRLLGGAVGLVLLLVRFGCRELVLLLYIFKGV
jgi:hypothetical protein